MRVPSVSEACSDRGRSPVSTAAARRVPWLRKAGQALSAIALVASLAPAPARADDDATVAMARERFREGVQYFDLKQYDKARAAFLQAYALKRHPAVLLNLAQSELRSGHEADAAKHFAQYLREHGDASETERQAAEAGLTAAKALVAEVTVTVDEEGAAISVDGASEGYSPLSTPIFVKPGTRTITARKEGREVSVQLSLSAGQTTTANLRLRKAAATSDRRGEPEREPPAREEASSGAAAEVSFDGETAAPTGGRQPFFEWALESPVAWIGGGLAVLGFTGGVVFWISARNNYDQADDIADKIREDVIAGQAGMMAAMQPVLQPKGICVNPDPRAVMRYGRACRLYSENVDDGDRYRKLSWIGTGVGAVAVAGTLIYYFASAPQRTEAATRSSSPSARPLPWLGPSGGGFAVLGEF